MPFVNPALDTQNARAPRCSALSARSGSVLCGLSTPAYDSFQRYPNLALPNRILNVVFHSARASESRVRRQKLGRFVGDYLTENSGDFDVPVGKITRLRRTAFFVFEHLGRQQAHPDRVPDYLAAAPQPQFRC